MSVGPAPPASPWSVLEGSSPVTRQHQQLLYREGEGLLRGAWVVQGPAPGFSAGHDLAVVGSSPESGFVLGGSLLGILSLPLPFLSLAD